jgi:hypothetical protein
MEVPLPVISSPPAVPMPAQSSFEPGAVDPAEAETVINLPVTPRATEPSEVDTVMRAVATPRPPEPEITMPPRPAQPQPRPVAALPPVSMSLPADSGLELVETRSKATLMSESEPASEGPRRVRPARPVIVEEPLQIIETRKENSPPAG